MYIFKHSPNDFLSERKNISTDRCLVSYSFPFSISNIFQYSTFL